MPSLDAVYRRFGEVAEAAQLLETELGNIVLAAGLVEADLIRKPNKDLASAIFKRINRQTLGQLLKSAGSHIKTAPELEALLLSALDERNRLAHSFYRQHNFRRNSDEGRAIMISDLEAIHETLLNAYQAVLALSGIDLEALSGQPLPNKHVPIA
jgi:hypothetical protein